MGAFAIYVLETVIGKERVWPLWGVVVVRGFASQGYGEGDLRFETRERLLQPEDLFGIGLAELLDEMSTRSKNGITWPRVQTKMMAGTRSAN